MRHPDVERRMDAPFQDDNGIILLTGTANCGIARIRREEGAQVVGQPSASALMGTGLSKDATGQDARLDDRWDQSRL
eukprot:4912122-Heterocapsa_arctica.AAC.1